VQSRSLFSIWLCNSCFCCLFCHSKSLQINSLLYTYFNLTFTSIVVILSQETAAKQTRHLLHDVVLPAVAQFMPYVMSFRGFPFIVCTRAVLISQWYSTLQIWRCGQNKCTEIFLADFVFHKKLLLLLLLLLLMMLLMMMMMMMIVIKMMVMFFFLFLFFDFVTFSSLLY